MSEKDLIGPKVLVFLGDDMELGMTSCLNSNLGRNFK
jgi:hypothetical protein